MRCKPQIRVASVTAVIAWALLLSSPLPALAAPGDVEIHGTAVVTAECGGEGPCRFTHGIRDDATGAVTPVRFAGATPRGLKTGDRWRVRGKRSPDGGEILVAAGGNTGTLVGGEPSPPVLGQRKICVLQVALTDAVPDCSVQEVRDMVFTDPADVSVADMYHETTFQQLTLTGDVFGPYTINYATVDGCLTTEWADAADALAAADGVDVNAYDHVVYVVPKVADCSWAGVATLYGRRAWVNSCTTPGTTAHEIGHLFGMHHASTDTSATGGGVSEYGDQTDFMGYGGTKQVNAIHKLQLGWLPQTARQEITGDGVHRIAPLELDPATATDLQALEIALPNTVDGLFLSYRQPIGFDANLSSIYTSGVAIHRGDPESGSVRTYLLDTLKDGEAYYDRAAGVVITQIAHDAGGVTIDVAFTCKDMTIAPAKQYPTSPVPMDYPITVTNQDCGADATFDLAATVEDYLPGTSSRTWSATVTPSTLTLGPGESSEATLTITPGSDVSAPTQVDSSRFFGASAVVALTGGDGAVISQAATYLFDVGRPLYVDDLTVARVGSRAMRLSWTRPWGNGPAPVDRYEVYASRNFGPFGLIYTLEGEHVATGYSFTHEDPAAPKRDSHTYYVVAYDQAGNASAPSVLAGDLPPNNAPIATDDTIVMNLYEDVPLAILANDVDPDGDPLYMVHRAIEGPGIFTVSYGPTDIWIRAWATGTRAVTYTVYDGMGGTDTAIATVTVTDVHNPVVVDDVAETGIDTRLVIDVLANDTDPEGGALRIATVRGYKVGAVVTVVDETLHFTPAPGFVGIDSFQYRAEDAEGLLSGWAIVDVTVTEQPGPPNVDAGADQTLVDSDGDNAETVTLSGTGYDPDGGMVTFRWTDPSGAEIGLEASAHVTLPVGQYVFTLTVTDDEGEFTSDATTVTIEAAPPIADAGPDQTVADADDDGFEEVMLSGVGFDPYGGPLTFCWTDAEGAQVGTDEEILVTVPVGSHTFTLTVTDVDGRTANDGTSVTVDATGPPTPTTCHVGDLDGTASGQGKTWSATVAIQIVDGTGAPVANATVTGTWSGAASGTDTATTGGSGWASVSRTGIPKGSGATTFTVSAATHATLAYAPAANADPDGDSDGTSITVTKP